MEMKAKEIVIKGKVHDVGYRLFLLSEAESGFVEKFDARNVLINGEQHLIVLVGGAEERINRFVEFAKSNYPPGASVESVEVKDYGEEVRSIDSFRQSVMVFQLTKIAQAGVGMLGKQDAMLGKQDAMLGKMDAMLGKQDKTIEILEAVKGDTSKMLDKQDETIITIKEESGATREVVRDEGEKTREVMKEKIVEDVEWVKEEIIGIKATLSKVKEKVLV
ncbi:MAG: acylphosphatase, partial [Methanophagales archaeon]|nr:acylphosphatase [Methanophagales archaeon]